MIAGLVLRISPPTDGSKATHHTSPQRGGLSGLALLLLVGGHCPIVFDDLLRDHVRPRKIIEESADTPPADDAVRPLIDVSSMVMVSFLDIPFAPYTSTERVAALASTTVTPRAYGPARPQPAIAARSRSVAGGRSFARPAPGSCGARSSKCVRAGCLPYRHRIIQAIETYVIRRTCE